MKFVYKFFFCILLLFFSKCTGTYYGIDGPDVISRKEAVSKINNALMAKIAICGADETNLTYLYTNIVSNPRKVLDGAYYSEKDINSCVNHIYFGTCDTFLIPCSVSPKDFFGGGGLFQGGF
ncbi:MAG: hypothetical protein H7A23_08970 [Leptospiraceae bacterium]|nr:hypothetical protein [Leptospiraceae bacterium]